MDITPQANQYGTAQITMVLSDGTLTDTGTFILTVSGINDAPEIGDVADQETSQDETLS